MCRCQLFRFDVSPRVWGSCPYLGRISLFLNSVTWEIWGDYDILTTVFRDSVSWWWLCSTTCSWLTSSGCSSKDCIYMQSLFGLFRLMTFAFATTLHSVGVSGFICSNVLPVFCFFFGFYYSSFLRVARLYSLVIRSAQQYGIVSFSVLIYAHKFFGPDQQMPTPHTPLASG